MILVRAPLPQRQTFKDANGRTVGRSTTDAHGNTTDDDSMGGNTGRSVITQPFFVLIIVPSRSMASAHSSARSMARQSWVSKAKPPASSMRYSDWIDCHNVAPDLPRVAGGDIGDEFDESMMVSRGFFI
jgi:hypothetical protein